MQSIKLYLSEVHSEEGLTQYKIAKKCGYVASSPEYTYIKKALAELNIIESEKTKFEDIVLYAIDICTLLAEGFEVFIV